MPPKNSQHQTEELTHIGPVPVGTTLHRALRVVADAVARELADKHAEELSDPTAEVENTERHRGY